MKRSEMVSILHKLANEIRKDYTWEKFYDIFTIASDWNIQNPEEEIFVCEIYAVDGYENDGIMIEDEIYCYE